MLRKMNRRNRCVVEQLQQRSAEKRDTGLMAQTYSGPLIETSQLSRVYPMGEAEVTALRNVTLSVERGEFLGIVGVSGSGKSTLLHLLGGLDKPTAGSIRVGEQRLDTMSRHELTLYRRSMVGFVFQAFYLVPTLTAEANLCCALTFQGTYGAQRNELAQRALARVGLEQRSRHRPGQLSGGEQQRVAIARAIVHQPPLLLADEPTGNLDHRNATRLFELFRTIRHESMMTVILVTHDEELSSKYCDRVIRMRDGELRAMESGS